MTARRRPSASGVGPRCLLAAGLALLALVAQAQGAAPGGYVDRTIEGLEPEPVDDGDLAQRDTRGWPLYLRLEARLGSETFDTTGRARAGTAVYGLLETPNHGTLSLDGQYTPGAGGAAITLRQRGMPLGAGWVADHDLGLVTLAAPDITRLPGRIFLPLATVQGASAAWRRGDQDLQWVAGSGQPGRLAFLPATGFERLPGRRSNLGAQWRPGGSGEPAARLPGSTLAWLHEDARGVVGTGAARVDAASHLLAWRHEAGARQVQGQWLASRQSGQPGGRNGFWIDGQWTDGLLQHSAGLYRLEPGLTWAQQPMPNDLMGAYLRSRWRARQWTADGSLDLLRSVSGQRAAGYYATGNASWRLARDSRLGAGAALRDYAGRAWSTFADWRWANAWGDSGLRLELEGGTTQETTQRLVHDQTWTMPLGWNLATSVGLARIAADTDRGTPGDLRWTAATSFALPLSQSAGLRGTLETERGRNGLRRHAVNLGLNWRLNRQWSLEGSLVRTSGQAEDVAPLDPLAPIPLFNTDLSSRSFYLVLRYERESGSRLVPLGGRASEGGGTVQGEVFFDANRNGTREASEAGVPNASVFLDNRYAVRTDSQGRFEFPFVATGPRTVALRNDSLPLPWGVVDDGQARVDVRLRERTVLQFPVQRSE